MSLEIFGYVFLVTVDGPPDKIIPLIPSKFFIFLNSFKLIISYSKPEVSFILLAINLVTWEPKSIMTIFFFFWAYLWEHLFFKTVSSFFCKSDVFSQSFLQTFLKSFINLFVSS